MRFLALKKGLWDRIGIALSSICAIHCLLVPVVIALIPLWPAFEEFHSYTHLVFFLAITPTVILSLQRKHESKSVTGYLFSGVIIIFLAWLFHEYVGEYGEAGITLIGSALLIKGHWTNYNLKTGFTER